VVLYCSCKMKQRAPGWRSFYESGASRESGLWRADFRRGSSMVSPWSL
jgi:hypothetical protein